jgi:hypothetical protein
MLIISKLRKMRRLTAKIMRGLKTAYSRDLKISGCVSTSADEFLRQTWQALHQTAVLVPPFPDEHAASSTFAS